MQTIVIVLIIVPYANTDSSYAPQLMGGYNAAVRTSDECALRARSALDVDEPSIENIQVALLLSLAYFQAGKGKKSYMLLCQ